MKEKALNLLGLMRKANAVQIGETDTGTAAKAEQAKLILLASDASDNAVSRANGFVYSRDIPLIKSPFTKDEISSHVGKSGCSMMAVCDLGFADALLKILSTISPGEYDLTAKNIADRLEKEKQRKKEKSAHENNMRTGKRRKNA